MSPGHTCAVNRTPNRIRFSAPTSPAIACPVRPMVSIPCANTDGYPAILVA